MAALLEVGVERVAVPMLRPLKGTPPAWHVALNAFGLFLFFFTGVLAAAVIGIRCHAAIRERRTRRDVFAHGWLALAALVAARPLLLAASPRVGVLIELGFAGALLALVMANVSRGRDLGVQLGLPILVAPLLLHSLGILGGLFAWSPDPFDGPMRALEHAGVTALCVAALLTPYCFAPRPFARAVARPVPLVVAMLTASFGAVIARVAYAKVAKVMALALGLQLHPGKADPQLALYLLALATLTWTIVACATAASPARRQIGLGIVFVALGGYAFKWPHQFLLPLLGAALVVDAGRLVREEELAALPLVGEAPPVGDTAWGAYIAVLAQGLRRVSSSVHSLTTRGEGGLVSSLLVGEARGVPIRIRVERIDGSVLALDIVLGAEIDEARSATLSMQSVNRQLGVPPPGPPASPALALGNNAFAVRFTARGDRAALDTLFDEPMRERAEALLEGWLAYWRGGGLRYRVYPGRGAPVDHPMPLPDLAMGRVPSHADRLVALVELLVDIASRAELAPDVPAVEPQELGA